MVTPKRGWSTPLELCGTRGLIINVYGQVNMPILNMAACSTGNLCDQFINAENDGHCPAGRTVCADIGLPGNV